MARRAEFEAAITGVGENVRATGGRTMSQTHARSRCNWPQEQGGRKTYSNDHVGVEEKDLLVGMIVCVIEMIVMSISVPRRLIKAVWCDHGEVLVSVKMALVKILYNMDSGKNIHRSLVSIRESSCSALSYILYFALPNFVITVHEKRLHSV